MSALQLLLALSLAASPRGTPPPPILPPPQCLEPRDGPALPIDPTSAPSDDSFAAAWLKRGIAAACGGVGVAGGAAHGGQPAAQVSRLRPGAEQAAALQARGRRWRGGASARKAT